MRPLRRSLESWWRRSFVIQAASAASTCVGDRLTAAYNVMGWWVRIRTKTLSNRNPFRTLHDIFIKANWSKTVFQVYCTWITVLVTRCCTRSRKQVIECWSVRVPNVFVACTMGLLLMKSARQRCDCLKKPFDSFAPEATLFSLQNPQWLGQLEHERLLLHCIFYWNSMYWRSRSLPCTGLYQRWCRWRMFW